MSINERTGYTSVAMKVWRPFWRATAVRQPSRADLVTFAAATLSLSLEGHDLGGNSAKRQVVVEVCHRGQIVHRELLVVPASTHRRSMRVGMVDMIRRTRSGQRLGLLRRQQPTTRRLAELEDQCAGNTRIQPDVSRA